MIEHLNTFTKNGLLIGILSYDRANNIFLFEYDKAFMGFPFGELVIKNNVRKFTSDTIFHLFKIEESYGRDELSNIYNLHNLDSNESQWHMISNFIKKEYPNKGFYFES